MTKMNNKKETRGGIQSDTSTKFQSRYGISKTMTTGIRNPQLKIKQLPHTHTHTLRHKSNSFYTHTLTHTDTHTQIKQLPHTHTQKSNSFYTHSHTHTHTHTAPCFTPPSKTSTTYQTQLTVI